MTTIGKAIVISGIVILTVSSLCWILTGTWQWFAGGITIFLGSLMASAVISVEPKVQPPPLEHNVWNGHHTTEPDWELPTTPPPDEEGDALSWPPKAT